MDSALTGTRVKICGISTPQDAIVAAQAGADAIGLNFHPESPRYVEPEAAGRIVAALPPFVTSVGLFVDCPAARLRATLATVTLDLIQFHGGESPAECSRWGRPWIRALRVGADDWRDRLAALDGSHAGCLGVLLDAYVPGVPGGTGRRFDWSLVPDERPRPLILAGGLDPDNVGAAVERVRPWAVDVSGGVESAPGRKDHGRMRAFVEAVRAADAVLKNVH